MGISRFELKAESLKQENEKSFSLSEKLNAGKIKKLFAFSFLLLPLSF
jgi:hypothetical protein